MNNEVLELLKSIQGNITSMKSDIASMKGDITSMKGDIASMKGDINVLKEGQERIEKKLNVVFEQTADLTDFKTVTSDNIQSMKKDVKFIKRKVQDTEEDVFVIQDHLKLIK